jgi:hypothetical protein
MITEHAAWVMECLTKADALAMEVRRGLFAPSGQRICSCRNLNAVNAGIERACWHCEISHATTAYTAARTGRGEGYVARKA